MVRNARGVFIMISPEHENYSYTDTPESNNSNERGNTRIILAMGGVVLTIALAIGVKMLSNKENSNQFINIAGTQAEQNIDPATTEQTTLDSASLDILNSIDTQPETVDQPAEQPVVETPVVPEVVATPVVEKPKAAVVKTTPAATVKKSSGLNCMVFPASVNAMLRKKNPGPSPDGGKEDGKLVCHVIADGKKDKPGKSKQNPKGHNGGACIDPDERPKPSDEVCYPVEAYGKILNKYLEKPF